MRPATLGLYVLLAMGLSPLLHAADTDAPATPRVRKFTFTYAGAITKLAPGVKARVWLPSAVDNHEQHVVREKMTLPGKAEETVDKKYGNHLLYFEATAPESGEIPFQVVYRVERKELLASTAEEARPQEIELGLAATELEPADGSLTARVFADARPQGKPEAIARKIYETINGRMKYDKPAGQPWGRGDARWACDSRYGNCTDFHSLFISLCRDQKIASRFEIGFSIPTAAGSTEIAGYHCWAKFLADNKWLPVDISEANKNPALAKYYFGNLTADRVTFSVGRDLELQPAPAAKTVSFLVYPYVEVEGRPHTSFSKKFSYEDVKN